ncbi:hypothetical protein LRAMOSA09969 [Lichtheimia ramosa]|uniref:Uncharacterized protein n=1 Tax=Lichtheimia ramosa TaxID=688394 RepID=A0A077WNC1_9FUNG|nr:hypothetical protein LRAMOSA09969 [Lichtheimia ramosa]
MTLQESQQKEQSAHTRNPIPIASQSRNLELLVLEEKAEALRTDLLLRLEEMINQMREAFDKVSKTLLDTVSEWEQQAIDTLKADIRDIQELENEQRIRQEQLRRFVHATTTSFAEIFNKHGHHSKEQSSSRLTDNMQL